MRSLLAITTLAALLLAGSAYAQQPTGERSCGRRSGPRKAYLQKLVRQYHPDALAPAVQRDSVTVGFVFDSTCQVLRHAVGRRASNGRTVDSELARLFPDLRATDFSSSGVYSRKPLTPGHLMIVWAVLRRT
jgi:hypothetical protein